jgi:hypothetical protein
LGASRDEVQVWQLVRAADMALWYGTEAKMVVIMRKVSRSWQGRDVGMVQTVVWVEPRLWTRSSSCSMQSRAQMLHFE